MSQANSKKRQIAANWADIGMEQSEPTSTLLDEGLPHLLVDSALAAGALPKVEADSNTTLILLRVFDGAADQRAAGARELTRKLGIYLKGHDLLTVHRFSTSEFPRLFEATAGDRDSIITALTDRVIQTYLDALAGSEDQFEALETAVFRALKSKPFRLRDAYYQKRRLNVIRKMLKLHLDLIDSLVTLPESEKLMAHLRKGPRKKASQALANCEALLEGMNHLLQLQLSLLSQKANEANQKTNEVMRILTVFSVFFLPLSFIAGVYGMNFENMPELKHPHGYFGTIALMLGVALFIFIWFRKRGWIGKMGN